MPTAMKNKCCLQSVTKNSKETMQNWTILLKLKKKKKKQGYSL